MATPLVVWLFMTSYSWGVRGPGLVSTESGMVILPTSWRMEARAMFSISSSRSPLPNSVLCSSIRVIWQMRWTWPPDSSLRNSMAVARASIIPWLS